MFDLTGKTALVTGATGGIGGAVARALHARGATVGLSGTRVEVLQAFAAELGSRAHVLPANLGDKDSVEALVPAAEAAMGQVDILVNNAGVTRDNLFMRMKDDEWDTVIRVNLEAAFRTVACRAARDDEAALGSHRIGDVGRRHDGQCRAGQLRCVEGGPRRHVEVARRGGRQPQHHRQLRRARLHPDRNDDVLNEKQKESILHNVPMQRLGTADESPPRSSTSPAPRPPTDRPDAARQRRNGNDLNRLKPVVQPAAGPGGTRHRE